MSLRNGWGLSFRLQSGSFRFQGNTCQDRIQEILSLVPQTSQAESLVWDRAWMAGMEKGHGKGGHEPFSSLPRYNLSIETPTRHCTLVCGTRLTMFQRFLYLESQCPDKCTHIQNDLCAMRKCYCTSATCCRDKIGSIEPGIPGHSSHSPHPRTIKSSQTFTWPPFSYKEHPKKEPYFGLTLYYDIYHVFVKN